MAAVRGSDPPHARVNGIGGDMQQWRLRLPAMQSKSVLDGAPRKLIAPNHAAPPQQEGAVPATGQNTLRLPKCALSAPSQGKPLESHDLVTTPRVHHAARRRGGRVA